MYLNKLILVNFKNYEQADINFSKKLNCLVGDNGMGKTNILDAIYYLSLCKSFFNPIDSQNINNDKDFFVIQGEYDNDDSKEEVYCGIKRNKKKIFKRNKKEYQRLSDHIGLFPVVMISPADSKLITGGSDDRRKFINGVISQYDKEYLIDIINYNKALAQRNTLLKTFARTNSFDAETLAIWDEQLISNGERIYNKRVDFIEKLIPIFQKYYELISLGREKVQLVYQSHLENGNFRNILKEAQQKDRMLQYTSVGIHRDDLVFNLDGFPIKKIGSQGQQKTYLVALKFAKFDFIKSVNGFKPILLLDDIFDKFDSARVMQIIKMVSDENFGQIFITDTNKDHLEEILTKIEIENSIFYIENGKVVE